MFTKTSRNAFGLIPFRSPLLGESTCSMNSYEQVALFLFLWVLRCFTSPGALPTPMNSVQDYTGCPMQGFPIRKSPDQRLLPPPRSLSQAVASFFGAFCRAIHRTPLCSTTTLRTNLKAVSFFGSRLSLNCEGSRWPFEPGMRGRPTARLCTEGF